MATSFTFTGTAGTTLASYNANMTACTVNDGLSGPTLNGSGVLINNSGNYADWYYPTGTDSTCYSEIVIPTNGFDPTLQVPQAAVRRGTGNLGVALWMYSSTSNANNVDQFKIYNNGSFETQPSLNAAINNTTTAITARITPVSNTSVSVIVNGTSYGPYTIASITGGYPGASMYGHSSSTSPAIDTWTVDTVGTNVSPTPTGQSITSSAGAPTIRVDDSLIPTGQSITTSAGTPTVQVTDSTTLTGQDVTSGTTAPTVSILTGAILSGLQSTTGRGDPQVSSNYVGYNIIAANALQTVDSIFNLMGFTPADGDIIYLPTTVSAVTLVPELVLNGIYVATGRISSGPNTGTFQAIYYRLSNATYYDWQVTLVDGAVTSVVLTSQQIQTSSGASFVRVDIGVPVTGVASTTATTAPSVKVDDQVAITGQATTGSVGQLNVTTNGSVSTPLLGQSMTASIGSVAASGNASPNLAGQQINVGRGNITVQASSANATINLSSSPITTGTSNVVATANILRYYITYHMLEYVLGNTNI